MQETTNEDRRKELQNLLGRMRAHPERDWSDEKKRATVLQQMIAAETVTSG